jgi:membrane protease YdiL (CAAX protease family)
MLAVLGELAGPILRLFWWRLLATVAYHVPPLWGTALALGLAILFLRLHGLCTRARPTRALAEIRLRPLRTGWAWLAGALVGLVLLDVSWLFLLAKFASGTSVLADASGQPSAAPFEWLVRLANAGVNAPLVEEVVFRGWVLRRLERRFGVRSALCVTAALFALAHFDLFGLPDRLVHGCVFAAAVYATGSLWAAILLHACGNVFLVVVSQTMRDEQVVHLLQRGWSTLSAIVVLTVALVALAALLWRALPAARRGPISGWATARARQARARSNKRMR